MPDENLENQVDNPSENSSENSGTEEPINIEPEQPNITEPTGDIPPENNGEEPIVVPSDESEIPEENPNDEVGIYSLLNGMWNKITDKVMDAESTAETQFTSFKENNVDPMVDKWAEAQMTSADVLKEFTMMFGEDFYANNHDYFVPTGAGTSREYTYTGETFDGRMTAMEERIADAFTDNITIDTQSDGNKGLLSKAVAAELLKLYNVYTSSIINASNNYGNQNVISHIFTIGNLRIVIFTLSFNVATATTNKITTSFDYSSLFEDVETTDELQGYLSISKVNTQCVWEINQVNKLITCTKGKTGSSVKANGSWTLIQYYQLKTPTFNTGIIGED